MPRLTSRIVITAAITTVLGAGLSMAETSVASAASNPRPPTYGCLSLGDLVVRNNFNFVAGGLCYGSGTGPGTISGSGKRYTCATFAALPGRAPPANLIQLVLGSQRSPS